MTKRCDCPASAGSLSPRTNWASLAGFEFALPPVEEQKRLVELLGSIVVLEEELRTAEYEADRLQKAAMQDLLDADLNGWTNMPIGQIFKVTTGGTPSRNNTAFWNGDIPWVKTGEVNVSALKSTHPTAQCGCAVRICAGRSSLTFQASS